MYVDHHLLSSNYDECFKVCPFLIYFVWSGVAPYKRAALWHENFRNFYSLFYIISEK